MSEFKKCVIRGYIPHKTPKYPNRILWHDSYKLYLEQMYNTISSIINSRYKKNNIDWESDSVYRDFCILIFESSSKFINN